MNNLSREQHKFLHNLALELRTKKWDAINQLFKINIVPDSFDFIHNKVQFDFTSKRIIYHATITYEEVWALSTFADKNQFSLVYIDYVLAAIGKCIGESYANMNERLHGGFN